MKRMAVPADTLSVPQREMAGDWRCGEGRELI